MSGGAETLVKEVEGGSVLLVVLFSVVGVLVVLLIVCALCFYLRSRRDVPIPPPPFVDATAPGGRCGARAAKGAKRGTMFVNIGEVSSSSGVGGTDEIDSSYSMKISSSKGAKGGVAQPAPPSAPPPDKPELPAGWVELLDDKSKTFYYYNESTRETSWKVPK